MVYNLAGTKVPLIATTTCQFDSHTSQQLCIELLTREPHGYLVEAIAKCLVKKRYCFERVGRFSIGTAKLSFNLNQVTSKDRMLAVVAGRHRQVQADLLRQGELQETQTLQGDFSQALFS